MTPAASQDAKRDPITAPSFEAIGQRLIGANGAGDISLLSCFTR